MSERDKGSCAAVCRAWYAMSTFFLGLGLFLHTLRPARDLGHRLVIARRLRHAALFQDLRPVQQFPPLSLCFLFLPKRAGQVTLSGQGARSARRVSLF